MLNYLVESNTSFSLKEKIKDIIKKEKFEDILISEYDLEECELMSVLEDLDTYSLFSNKKVVIVKNIDKVDIESKEGKHLLKYLKNSNTDNLFIMLSKKLDTRKKITKELKKNANYLKIEDDPGKIIKEELKDYKLDSGVVNMLLEYTNNNIDAIKSECDKLKIYKIEEKSITKKDIETLCIKRLGDSTNLTFDLVRYISKKDKKNSLIAYKELQSYNVDDMAIMGLLESQLRLLEQVIALEKEGKRKNEIASILNIHPYRIEKTQELLRYVSKYDVDDLIRKLAKKDLDYKSGKDLSKRPLEMLLLNM